MTKRKIESYMLEHQSNINRPGPGLHDVISTHYQSSSAKGEISIAWKMLFYDCNICWRGWRRSLHPWDPEQRLNIKLSTPRLQWAFVIWILLPASWMRRRIMPRNENSQWRAARMHNSSKTQKKTQRNIAKPSSQLNENHNVREYQTKRSKRLSTQLIIITIIAYRKPKHRALQKAKLEHSFINLF